MFQKFFQKINLFYLEKEHKSAPFALINIHLEVQIDLVELVWTDIQIIFYMLYFHFGKKGHVYLCSFTSCPHQFVKVFKNISQYKNKKFDRKDVKCDKTTLPQAFCDVFKGYKGYITKNRTDHTLNLRNMVFVDRWSLCYTCIGVIFRMKYKRKKPGGLYIEVVTVGIFLLTVLWSVCFKYFCQKYCGQPLLVSVHHLRKAIL